MVLQSELHATVEIGYIFDPAHSGHGYATEAARALLGLAFDQLGAHRVIARIDDRNSSSLARTISGENVMSMPCAPSPLRMKALNELKVW